MSVRILRASFLVLLAAMPVVVLACGDDEAAAPSTATTVVPDASVAPDAAVEAATVAPIVVTLASLPYVLIKTGYVVFYPKESPDAPVSVPITSFESQTVAKAMPKGADVVVVLPFGPVSYVYQIDDVGSGESIYLDLGVLGTDSSSQILFEVPSFADAGNSEYAFSSCADTARPVTPDVGTQRTIPEACRGADGNARFVATTTSPPLAISILVYKIVNAAHLQLTPMPAWTTSSPVAWSFTGAPPADTTVDAKVFATSTGQYGGFELGRLAAVAQ